MHPMVELAPLHALILEDNPDDAELMILALGEWMQKVHVYTESQIVTSEAEFRQALQSETPWDVVISDYVLPQFSAPAAYAVLRGAGHHMPFIVVTGSLDDRACLALLDRGAADYLLKDRLQRLGPAVERAVEHHRLLARTQRGLMLGEEIQSRLDDIIKKINEHGDIGWTTRG